VRAAALRPLALVLILVLATLGPAAAQPAAAPQRPGDLLPYFYKDPCPERLVGYLEAHEARHPKWDAYPPVAGFFAVIFRAHPDWIERLAPQRFGPKTAATLAAALRLSGQAGNAPGLRSRLASAAPDPKLMAEFANLPSQLPDLQIRTPTHLDLLWGASFASGDGRHARKIMDFFANAANRSEHLALDLAQLALVMTKGVNASGSKEALTELRRKHGDDAFRQMVFAATALWALGSNARQHDFVDRAVARYIEEHPQTPATKALQVFRPQVQRT
jgi:hypothetical protein